MKIREWTITTTSSVLAQLGVSLDITGYLTRVLPTPLTKIPHGYLTCDVRSLINYLLHGSSSLPFHQLNIITPSLKYPHTPSVWETMPRAVCVHIPPALFPTWKSDAWIGPFIAIDVASYHPFSGRSLVLGAFVSSRFYCRGSAADGSNPRYFHAVWTHLRDAPHEEERSLA